MKLRYRNSIALELTILVLGGTSLVLALVMAYTYVYSRGLILAESEAKARNLTLAVANRIEQEFRSVAKIAEALGSSLTSGPCEEQTLLHLLRSTVSNNKEVFGSAIAFEPFAFRTSEKAYAPYYFKAPKGLEFAQLGTDAYDYFRRDWYYIPKVLKKPVWTEPYYDAGAGNVLMVTYAYPILEQEKEWGTEKLKAVVTVDVSLEWLTDLVHSIPVGRTGYCLIVSATGTFVTNPKRDLVIGQSVFSLAEQLDDPGVRRIGRAMIREKSGFVEMGPKVTGTDSFFAFAGIPSPGWSLGAIFAKDEIFEEVNELHQRTLLLAALGMILLLGVSLLVARSIARPLRKMARATARVAKGDLDLNLSDIQRSDEVGQLASAFTHMTEGIKQRDFIRDTFGRYLTKEVVNRLLEHKDGLQLGGESREISMMMSDLRGFTALTTTMNPDQVIAFLNRYLGKMLEILMDHRGTIDEIIGDGILAFFGAPESHEDHAAAAVACALKMQIAMDEINDLNEADGLPRLEMGVAVNTGKVVVGNIGSERRTKYGAVGSEVNFTGRIESFTVGGQVLISDSTYQGLKHVLDVGDVIHVEMKGIPGKVPLYDVRGIRGEHEAHLPEREDHPVPLKKSIDTRVFRLSQKTVSDTWIPATIAELSLTSAIMNFSDEIHEWEDLRMVLLNDQQEPLEAAAFGKILSVAKQDGHYQARVRFTSVSPEAYKIFRNATSGSATAITLR
jgi:class 3 adenylate cyclase/HAMP domain-containing protein